MFSVPEKIQDGIELNAGGIAGEARNGYIEGCSSSAVIAPKTLDEGIQTQFPNVIPVEGALVQSFSQKSTYTGYSDAYIGGIVGQITPSPVSSRTQSYIEKCSFSGSISGMTYGKYMSAGSYIGGISGYSYATDITNSAFTGTIDYKVFCNGSNADYSSRTANVGGITGYARNGDGTGTVSQNITNCISNGKISTKLQKTDNLSVSRSNCSVGGICGQSLKGVMISYCANASDVYFENVELSPTALDCNGTSSIGGIIGDMENYSSACESSVRCCFNTGNIESLNAAGVRQGGIAGYIYNGASPVSDCYNTGDITATDCSTVSIYNYIGGIIGYDYGSTTATQTVSGVFNLGDCSLVSNNSCSGNVGQIFGCTSYTSAENSYYITGSVPATGYSYTSAPKTTGIAPADAHTSGSWGTLTSGNWKWSALYGYPILKSSPSIWGRALWGEPTAFRLSSFQYSYTDIYEIGDSENIWDLLYVSTPSMYITPHDNKPLLISAESNMSSVLAVNGETITAVGSGKANLDVDIKVLTSAGVTTTLSLSAFAKTVVVPQNDKYQRTTSKITRIRPSTYFIEFKADCVYSGLEANGASVKLYENNTLQTGSYIFVKTGITSVKWGTSNESVCIVMGDCTGDGSANATDINKMRQITVGLEQADNDYCLEAADVNGDGVVDGFDVALTDLYASGKITADELLSHSAG